MVRNWYGMVLDLSNRDVYATASDGRIYKQPEQIGDFILVNEMFEAALPMTHAHESGNHSGNCCQMCGSRKRSDMLRGRTDAETCRINGWGVGTMLEGAEAGHLARIVVTAIGEEAILARQLGSGCVEQLWTLTCRDWRLVGLGVEP